MKTAPPSASVPTVMSRRRFRRSVFATASRTATGTAPTRGSKSVATPPPAAPRRAIASRTVIRLAIATGIAAARIGSTTPATTSSASTCAVSVNGGTSRLIRLAEHERGYGRQRHGEEKRREPVERGSREVEGRRHRCAGADGLHHADLPGLLCHERGNDVHDEKGAHEETHDCEDGQQQHHRLHRVGGTLTSCTVPVTRTGRSAPDGSRRRTLSPTRTASAASDDRSTSIDPEGGGHAPRPRVTRAIRSASNRGSPKSVRSRETPRSTTRAPTARRASASTTPATPRTSRSSRGGNGSVNSVALGNAPSPRLASRARSISERAPTTIPTAVTPTAMLSTTRTVRPGLERRSPTILLPRAERISRPDARRRCGGAPPPPAPTRPRADRTSGGRAPSARQDHRHLRELWPFAHRRAGGRSRRRTRLGRV